MAVSCDFCGRTAPGSEADDGDTDTSVPPLTWSTAVENGRQRIFCDTCSREHLRAMESKLDSEWW